MMSKKRKGQKGFTLVELLVVMAIMAVLIGISVAGLGYALRKSRNIARSSAMSNLDKAFASYYADNQKYPATGTSVADLTKAGGDLDEYLEGTWDAGPPGSDYYYRAGNNDTIYSICVSQEKRAATTSFVCLGPAVGSAGWPTKDSSDCSDIDIDCGTGGGWDGSIWGETTTGGGGGGGGGGGCIPHCKHKECGDDGCGGSCGSCAPGYVCENQVCEVGSSGGYGGT